MTYSNEFEIWLEISIYKYKYDPSWSTNVTYELISIFLIKKLSAIEIELISSEWVYYNELVIIECLQVRVYDKYLKKYVD
jgi:hypothetical protein